MTGRVRRQQVIADLIARRPVRSQSDLRDLLAQRGIEVTQATLSRDLREMGVAKSPRGYVPAGVALAVPPAANGRALEDALRAFVIAAEQAGNLVVLRTGPGHAALVALELDRSPPPGVVGTIAGDDTIFVAARTAQQAARLAMQLKRTAHLAGGGATR
ncbi:MAG: hypothetical protein KJZ54_00825 [Phycisphaerales bacterium]|nr:hypothetical protein [Phycisphaerales bacterium]